MQLTCTVRVQSLNNRDDGRGKTYRPCQKPDSLITAWPSFHLSTFVRCFVYNKPKVKFMYSSNHMHPGGVVIFRILSDWPIQPPPQWVPGIFGGKAAGTWCWPPTYPILGRVERKSKTIPLFSLWAFMPCSRANLYLFLTIYNAKENNYYITHKTHLHFSPMYFLTRTYLLLVTREGLAFSSANHCQGQLQTPQSLPVIFVTWSQFRVDTKQRRKNASELQGRRTKIVQG